MQSVHPQSSWDINLFSVGRAGVRVTLVQWGRMGRWADALVPAFKKAPATALARLGR
ncbi:hypothetical protein ACLF6K_38650 (plasmid) [Streptomyces xanthophaeus]|uniref:hypothetical protein n=1 Tax=Streptomyces xanthophaeus TaxID=67385 RepID=UPI0039902EA1